MLLMHYPFVHNIAYATSSAENVRQQAHAVSDYTKLVQSIYVAYFGRPADPDGLAYFQKQFQDANAPTTIAELIREYSTNAQVKDLVDFFGKSEESNALYNGTTDEFIAAIYQNLFNRAPDVEGGKFWANLIDRNVITKGNAAITILIGAQTTDMDTISKKIGVANYFTTSVSDSDKKNAYSGMDSTVIARNMLRKVQYDTDQHFFISNINSTIALLKNIKSLHGNSDDGQRSGVNYYSKFKSAEERNNLRKKLASKIYKISNEMVEQQMDFEFGDFGQDADCDKHGFNGGHAGIDILYKNSVHTQNGAHPVYSASKGIFVGYASTVGGTSAIIQVKVKNANSNQDQDYFLHYRHLISRNPNLNPGDSVGAGDFLGDIALALDSNSIDLHGVHFEITSSMLDIAFGAHPDLCAITEKGSIDPYSVLGSILDADSLSLVASSGTSIEVNKSYSLSFRIENSDTQPSLIEIDWHDGKAPDRITLPSGINVTTVSRGFDAAQVVNWTATVVKADGNPASQLQGNFSVVGGNQSAHSPTISIFSMQGNGIPVNVRYSVTLAAKDLDANLKEIEFEWGDGSPKQYVPVSGAGDKVVFSKAFPRPLQTKWLARAIDVGGLTSDVLSADYTVFPDLTEKHTPTINKTSNAGDSIETKKPYELAFAINDVDGNLSYVQITWLDIVDAKQISGATDAAKFTRTFPSAGKYSWIAKAYDTTGLSSGEVRGEVEVVSSSPNNRIPELLLAASNGTEIEIGKPYVLTFNAADKDGNLKKVNVDWGDGSEVESKPVSGEVGQTSFTHTYKTAGKVNWIAQAIDLLDAQSAVVNGSVTILAAPNENHAPVLSVTQQTGATINAGDDYEIRFKTTDEDLNPDYVELTWGDVTAREKVSANGDVVKFTKNFPSAGTIIWSAIAYDLLGAPSKKVEGKFDILSIEPADVAPELQMPQQPEPAVKVGQTYQVVFNVSDSNADLSRVEFSMDDGSAIISKPAKGASASVVIDKEFSAIGTVRWTAIAYDDKGAASNAIEGVVAVEQAVPDNEIPTLETDADPVTSVKTGETFTVVLRAADKTLDLDRVTMKWGDDSPADVQPVNESGGTVTFTHVFTNATNVNWQAIAYDKANQPSEPLSGTLDVTLPTPINVKPSIALATAPVKSIKTNETYSIEIRAKDENGNLRSVTVDWGDGTEPVTKPAQDGEAVVSFATSFASKQTIRWNAVAEDSLGLKSQMLQGSVNVIQAIEHNPSLNLNGTPASSVMVGQNYTVNLNGADEDSDLDYVEVNWNDGTPVVRKSAKGASASVDFSKSFSKPGRVNWSATAYDAKSNKSVMIQRSFDVLAPVVHNPTLALNGSPASSIMVGQSYTVNLSGGDADGDLDYVEVNWNDGTPVVRKSAKGASANVDFSKSFSNPGRVNWSATAYDAKTNKSTMIQRSFDVVAPATRNPTLTLNGTPASSIMVGQSYTVNLSGGDADGDLDYVEVNWNDGTPVVRKSAKGASANVDFSKSFSNPGRVNWSATAYDAKTNKSTMIQRSFDVVAPATRNPTLTLNGTPASSIMVGQSYTVNLSGGDADGDLDYVEVNWNDGTPVVRKSAKGASASVDFSKSFSNPGRVSWSATAYDSKNNRSVMIQRSFDVVAPVEHSPTITRTDSSGNVIGTNQNYRLGFSVEDKDGNLSYVDVNWNDGSSVQRQSVSGTNGNANFYKAFSNAGTIRWSATAYDASGKRSTMLQGSFSVNAPVNQAPTLSLANSPPSTVRLNQAYVLSFRARDDDSNLSSVEVNWNDGTAVVGKAVSGSTGVVDFSKSFAKAGTIRWSATAYDAKGAKSGMLQGSFSVR